MSGADKQQIGSRFVQSMFLVLALSFYINGVKQSACEQFSSSGNASAGPNPVVNCFTEHSMTCYYQSKAIDTLTKFEKQKPSPPVVLLGSSLMLYPFWEMDRCAGINVGHVGYYPFSKELERKLGEAGIADNQVFNWSTLLQMNSDSYLIARQYLMRKPAPKLIVLGLAPRDFFDNLIPSPADTTYFQNYADWKYWFNPQYVSSLEHFSQAALNKYCPLYGERDWIQPLINTKVRDTLFALLKLRPLPPRLVSFYMPRYQNITLAKMERQSHFLHDFIQLCQENETGIILINMPLSSSNRALLPPGVYEQFCNHLSAIALSGNVTYLDLSRTKEFSDGDYLDGVHLNCGGGQKLLKLLVPEMAAKLKG